MKKKIPVFKNKYEERKWINSEWKKCKRAVPEFCENLEKERESWPKSLTEDEKIKECKKAVDFLDETIVRLNNLYRQYGFREISLQSLKEDYE